MSDTRVGLVGDDTVAERLTAAGHSVVSGTLSDLPSTERVIAVGRDAVRTVAVSDSDPVVIPVAAGRGIRSLTRDALVDTLGTLSEAQIESHPVLTVTVAGAAVGAVVRDATVVTTEAARISEYEVATATDTINRFRADGVVAATPAGSTGYARRIGGPVLTPTTDIGAVVPIAPFKTNPDHWVLPLEGLSITVKRDEATVGVYADGDRVATVDRGESVSFSSTGTLRTVVTAESRSRFR